MSEGLCISPSDSCALESVGASSRKKRLVGNTEMTINESAIQLCNLYLGAAVNATEQLNMTYAPEMIYNLNISCVHDVIMTNDSTVSINSKHLFFSYLETFSGDRKQSDSFVFRLKVVLAFNTTFEVCSYK